jgi:hypothetical protein
MNIDESYVRKVLGEQTLGLGATSHVRDVLVGGRCSGFSFSS